MQQHTPNQHGTYQLAWRGNVLLVSIAETWNEVAARALHADAKKLWESHGLQRWAMLIDARMWEGETPESFRAMGEFLTDAARHGLTAGASIMPTDFHKLIVQTQVDNISKLIVHKHCSTVDEGLDWLSHMDQHLSQ